MSEYVSEPASTEQAESQTVTENLTKVDDLWFATDIIVIRAENKIFRVLGSILGARSSVFHDMFAFPQPHDMKTEKIDGHPVVQLQDKAEDVEVFLRAIYDSNYFMPSPAPVHMKDLLAVLRLSHKYDVPYLHRRALHHLISEGWYRETYRLDESETKHVTYIDVGSPIDALSVALAAVEVNAPWLLPYAYYRAGTYPVQKLSVAPLMEGETRDCAVKALVAHTYLACGVLRMNSHLTEQSPPTCVDSSKCDGCRKINLCALWGYLSVGGFTHPLRQLDVISRNMEKNGMCSYCLEDAKTKQHEAATKFWDDLPGILGLPPWEELNAMKRAAMGEDGVLSVHV
ncbi:BTB domain-containing protein [Favolaschia claudopus]|uniref:BTB domain-containing protein n=1 Tax=Favolaschia claudopus TaxID=2862362 RepID=A0AAW0AYY2_9AGAR